MQNERLVLQLPNGKITVELRYLLELDEASPSNNVIKGMHFHVYKKTRTLWKSKIAQAVNGKKITTIDKAYLIIERYSSGRGLDWDNAYGGLKPVLDCLVCPSDKNPDGLGLIQDDNPENMPFPPYFCQNSAKRNQGKLTIKIYEIVNDDLNSD